MKLEGQFSTELVFFAFSSLRYDDGEFLGDDFTFEEVTIMPMQEGTVGF